MLCWLIEPLLKASQFWRPLFIYSSFYQSQFNIWMISSVRKFASLAFSLQTRPVCRFADNWKDRDEASEKVYITEAEKETIKRLLKKVESEREDNESNLEEFERKLSQIMRRYKIENPTLAAEILSLHKNLSK